MGQMYRIASCNTVFQTFREEFIRMTTSYRPGFLFFPCQRIRETGNKRDSSTAHLWISPHPGMQTWKASVNTKHEGQTQKLYLPPNFSRGKSINMKTGGLDKLASDQETLMDKQLNCHCTRFEFRPQFLSNLSLCRRGNKTMWITCSSLKSLVFVSLENCSGFFY